MDIVPPNSNMDKAKEDFLKEFGESYGYPNAPKNIDDIRATEFKRLDGSVYLDHAGATLYSELQMEAIFKDLTTTVYGNPHSQSSSSIATSDVVEDARHQISVRSILSRAVKVSTETSTQRVEVLRICNASPKDYKCIFTSGATAALKLVGEAFPWSSQSTFMYTIENHNSVLGIREYALNEGAAALAVDFVEAAESDTCRSTRSSIKVSQYPLQRRSKARVADEETTGDTYNLFAFPSECNFSGVRFNLDLIDIIKADSEGALGGSQHCRGRWMVLLDAAKGCSTDPPDLSKHKADFVVISFYKLFGYPTGLGALIVRNEAAKLLKKTYFSGGTVAASIADMDFVKRREGIEESLEDGTPSYLNIASIRHGLDILNTLTTSAISRHTSCLARYTRNMLLALRHADGEEVCKIYGPDFLKASYSGHGPVVSFNLKRLDGSWVGYREVEKLASLSGIQLRTGCFCNPGACSKYLGLSHSDLISNIEAGHVCWDDHDVIHGKPTGAVRVSFGYMSTFEDAWKFMNFIVSSFVLLPTNVRHPYPLRSNSIQLATEGHGTTTEHYLTSIVVYPIKSCAGFRVNNWPLSSTGLLYDREWLLKSMNGEILTQKKVPEMYYIGTKIDLKTGILHVESPRCKEKLLIELKSDFFAAVEEISVHAQSNFRDSKGKTHIVYQFRKRCYLLTHSLSGHDLSFFCEAKDRTVGVHGPKMDIVPPNSNMDKAKEDFLKEFGESYGYPNAPKNIDDIRATEFKRLDGSVYLDHAGATLYSELQMEAIFKDLTTTVYGNPHSQSSSSVATSDVVEDARHQISVRSILSRAVKVSTETSTQRVEVLRICNASPKDYKCIFTSGATAALKLVGEAFPWSSQSTFMYTIENHNSVLGIREYALNEGAAALAVDFVEAAESDTCRSTRSSIKVSQYPLQRRSKARVADEETTGDTYNLFAFPSECNFSGVRFNLDLIDIIKADSEGALGGSQHCRGRWMVLLDAAKGCSTDPPDLSKHKADFVVISFYKLFGYPTGLGALIVRNEAAKLLKKTYFSGGTVAASIADMDFVKRREGIEESLEDGTPSYLNIASIRHGLDILNTLTTSAISRHTSCLARYTRNMLLALRHADGEEVCKIYGPDFLKASYSGHGPVVSFNLKRPDGSWVGYREVEKLASLSGIQLRTGCFCNPGACSKYLGLSHSDLISNIEAGHVCWDDHDVIHGKPTGAVRVSFGYMSTFEDAWKFMNFIVSSFVLLPTNVRHPYPLRSNSIQLATEGHGTTTEHYLTSIVVYPIKSCAGFRVNNWPLSSTGLLYDREWLLKSMNGEILTQKKVPEMYYIGTKIDLKTGILHVESPRCKEKLLIELKSDFFAAVEEISVHAQRYEVLGYDNAIDAWFSNAVGRPCYLLRSSPRSCIHLSKSNSKSMGICRDVNTRLNFVNEAQLLLISEESVSELNHRLNSITHEGSVGLPTQVDAMRFRPNLVISGGEPYAEDRWSGLKIGSNHFQSLGGCNRCQMINLNYQAGEVQKSNEPLSTLAAYRRAKGKILFGILLRYEHDNKVGEEMPSWLQVGQEVLPNTE